VLQDDNWNNTLDCIADDRNKTNLSISHYIEMSKKYGHAISLYGMKELVFFKVCTDKKFELTFRCFMCCEICIFIAIYLYFVLFCIFLVGLLFLLLP